MKLGKLALISSLLVLLFLPYRNALAHQPYCEQADLTSANPWQVPDVAVSSAYFGNLYPAGDVDYFTFAASAGQSVLLSLSIPAIDGQAEFAPVMVVFGPGIDGDKPDQLPGDIRVPKGQGALLVPLGDAPVYWFEPFGKRYYWNWENYFFATPETATYTVALWHPQDQLGRYSFVIGAAEIRGGDQACMAAMNDYWTPLVAGESPYPASAVATAATHAHADGSAHDHSQLLAVATALTPFVDLQVLALADGGYNVRVQTLNFTFAPQHVGLDPMGDEGHAHLYIDDVKIARLYGEWYYLDALPANAQQISVVLYANNHQALAVDGVAISDMVEVADIVPAPTY